MSKFRQRVEFFRVSFQPDEPVEAFHAPLEKILSMGHPKPKPKAKTRRSGMNRRLAMAQVTPDEMELCELRTQNSWD